jgi:hypothetical protein
MHHKLLIALFILLNLAVAARADAATITALPNDVSATTGDTFSIRYLIDSQGEKNYTAKLVLNFPATLLKVTSFQFASGWVALSQPGYDSLDNTKGVLIKTAGYPKGVSSSALFATVQFQMLKTATGTITVQDDSLVLNAKNKNVFKNASTTVAVTIGPSTQKTGQNLFDVALGVAPTPQSFNWMPWIIVGLLCLLVISVSVILLRRMK